MNIVAKYEQYLKKWYFWATHSQLEPMKTAAKTSKNHWDGVLRWFTSSMTNGILEGINSLIQSAKRRARGYRTTQNHIIMICLVSGKLAEEPNTCNWRITTEIRRLVIPGPRCYLANDKNED